MKLGKRLVAFAITIILLVTSISRIDVCAAENSLDINSEIVFEGYGQDEIEIPNIQVPDIIYNAEGNEKCNNTFQIDRTQTLSISEDDENTDPDNAVEILNGIPKVNNLATDVIRWYFFEIEELSKVTMFLEMDETIDADLYLFSLDVNSGELTNIAVSLNEGTGIIEAIGRKLETGFYFIAVSGFEGEGNFSLGLYTSTKDIENEFNDSTTTATEVSGVFDINGLHGVIDSPYDYDFYKITLSEASAVRFELKYTSDKYAIYYHSGNAMYAITDDLYALDAGTHYFVVLRTDGGFSSTDTYCLYITNIAPILANIVHIKFSILFPFIKSSPYIVSFYYNCFITLQGFPTATTFDGISLFTTLPAPIIVLSPIVTPGSTITFPPIHTLFPTFIGFAYSNPLFLLSASSGCPAV